MVGDTQWKKERKKERKKMDKNKDIAKLVLKIIFNVSLIKETKIKKKYLICPIEKSLPAR